MGFLASKLKHMTFLMFAALIGGVPVGLLGVHDVRGVLADKKWPLAIGGVLVTIAGIGTAAAVASMVPGGLGVQEGTMTGVFTLLGVDVDHAVALAVMFRFLYFFVPFAMSLVFYKWLLSRRDPSEATCLN